ncbi:MAG: hypothetical protein ABR955_09545 [Verrucomicrobiota bacterium]|jgi:20S proteasome alpha/beta subunit
MNRLESDCIFSQKRSWNEFDYSDNPLMSKPEPPMTQIIGIVCKQSILVASESRYTKGRRTVTGNQKISAIRFKNLEDALVAEAGIAEHSNLAVRFMREIAAERIIDSESSVAEIAEEAMEKTREYILNRRPKQKRPYTDGELSAIFTHGDNKCALMVAYYFGGKPYLSTIHLKSWTVEKCFPFATIGAADDLATFMLKQFQFEKLAWKEAFPMIIDVLDRIEDEDTTCGGQVKVAGLDPLIWKPRPMMAGFWQDEDTNRVVKKLRALRAKSAKNIRRTVSS